MTLFAGQTLRSRTAKAVTPPYPSHFITLTINAKQTLPVII